MIRVLVVDDHRLVRAGLITLLEAAGDIEVVGEAADGRQALEVARTAAPDVTLMDLSMPVLDGVAATRLLLEEQPQARVVALTSFSDRQRVNDVLAAGAIGYLLKDSRPEDLLAAVRSAAEGHAPLDPRVAGSPGRCCLAASRPPPTCSASGRSRSCGSPRPAWPTSRSPAGSVSARAP
jgi:DNA-binding NarL/FixJ family response regulator